MPHPPAMAKSFILFPTTLAEDEQRPSPTDHEFAVYELTSLLQDNQEEASVIVPPLELLPEIPDEDESMQPIPVHPERIRCLGHHPVTVMSHSQSQGPVPSFEISYFTTAYTTAFSDVSSSPLSLKDIRRATRKLGRNNRPGFRISSLAMTRILCPIPENDALSFAPPQGICERPTPRPKANDAPQRIRPDTENQRYVLLLKPFGSLTRIFNSNGRPDRYLGDVGKPPQSNPRTTRAVSRKFGQSKGHVLNQ